jgi:hypothetical protein
MKAQNPNIVYLLDREQTSSLSSHIQRSKHLF